MWWTMPEAGEQRVSNDPVRALAIVGSVQRRQRTILTMVPVGEIRPNPDQPRKHFDEAALADLSASIKTHGLLQPIVVRRHQGGYELVAGERRLRAAQRAGIDRLPALIREVADPLEIALLENLQREDLSPLEEAEGLATLIERHGYSHREVADLLGKSRPYVSNTLSLTRLPDEVKSELQQERSPVSRELLMSVAREDSDSAALALWNRLRNETVSVRQFREERSGTRRETALQSEVVAAARRLSRALERLMLEDATTEADPRLAGTLEHTRSLIQRQLDRDAG